MVGAHASGCRAAPRVAQVGLPVPARALRAWWSRTPLPPIEALVGRCDVIHGTNFVSPPTLRAAEVVTVHDLTFELLPETVSPDVLAYRTLVPRALARGAHVVTPSHAVASDVCRFYGVPAGRVHPTPLGVSTAWSSARAPDASARSRLGLPGRYLVFVGSLDPRKNLATLVAAHALARSTNADVPDLVLAGPAGRAKNLAADGVIQTGWLDAADLRTVVAGATALVLPSLDEGFGLPVLESLACGHPVVVSDIPALREVAGENGVRCAPEVGPLAAALVDVLAVPDEDDDRERRRRWAAGFTWERTASATLGAYRAALS